MTDAIRTALGMVGDLLPFSIGGPLPVSPRLPDLQGFLSQLDALLGGAPSETGAGEKVPEEAAALLRAFRERVEDLPPAERRELAASLRDFLARVAEGLPEDSPQKGWLQRIVQELGALAEAEPLPEGEVGMPGTTPTPGAAPAGGAAAATPPLPAPLAAAAGGAGGQGATGNPSGALFARVLRAARMSHAHGISRVHLVLDPEGLGEVEVEMALQRNEVEADLRADRPGTREEMRSRLPELRLALERLGLEVKGLTVGAETEPAAAAAGKPPLGTAAPERLIDFRA